MNTTDSFNTAKDTLIPQSDEKKWPCADKMKNGEATPTTVVTSPNPNTGGVTIPLSGMNDIPFSCSAAKLPAVKRPGAVLVRLADESPKRKRTESSDTSTYDSYNWLETDICRDSSDTDTDSSLSSKHIETINVEYEVASASGSENLFSTDSSSGTDDFCITAVALCDAISMHSSDFADFEDGSSAADSEFSAADYWECAKCKNKKNNPMFRNCEKCFQIRRTHFPPPPRFRKNRSRIGRRRSRIPCQTIQHCSYTPDIDSTRRPKLEDPANSITPSTSSGSVQSGPLNAPGRLLVGKNSHFTSTDVSSSDDDTTPSLYYTNSNGLVLDKNDPNPAQKVRRATKRKFPKVSSKHRTSAKRTCYERKPFVHALPVDSINETDFALSQSICGTQDTQKDSGFSSAPSSQERKNEDVDDLVSANGNGGDTSDTVTSELSDSEIVAISKDQNCIPSSVDSDLFPPIKGSASCSVKRSTTEPIALSPPIEGMSPTISPLVQSISECSDAYTNVKRSHSNPEFPEMSSLKKSKLGSLQCDQSTSTDNDGGFPPYDSCMTCLTEPKNGVFVHSRFLHLCCCYKCAVKIWNKNKKCPICNCSVKNVMKLFVH